MYNARRHTNMEGLFATVTVVRVHCLLLFIGLPFCASVVQWLACLAMYLSAWVAHHMFILAGH